MCATTLTCGAGVKVQLVSGYSDLAEMNETDRTFASTLLNKPFPSNQLLTQVHSVLDS